MQLDILGPIRVCHEDRSPVVLTGLQGLLLAMLVAARGRPVPTDRLLDAMWGDNPCPRAAHRLQTHVHRLRRTLGGPDVLQAVGGGYVLQVPPGATDVERFENLIDEAAVTADADPRRAQELLGQACGLWRGRPFDGQTGAGLSIEAQRLDGLRLTARERLNAARLACREPEAVIEEVPSLIAEHPLRERLYELLMAAHALQGRPTEALEVHRQARHRLAEELGLDVGPGLRRLQEQVLRGGAPAPETFLTPRRSPAPAAGAPAAGVSAAGGSVTDVSVTGSASGRAATSGAVPPPAQLPAPPRGFHGREELLARLDELLGAAPAGASEAAPGDAAGSRIVALTGGGGTGKTALALHWAHGAVTDFPDGCLYADLRGFGPEAPLDPSRMLAWFLIALGVDAAGVPASRAERSSLLRSLTSSRRMLIVLDNARDADQVRPLLPGSPRSAVLVTSRADLRPLVLHDGAHQLTVPLMSPAESRALLGGTRGPRPSEELRDSLAEACSHLPLALRIMDERLRLETVETAPALLRDLQDERLRLDLLDSGDEATSVRTVFSWSCQRLSTSSARLFRLLGTAPARWLDVPAVAALAGLGPAEARRGIEELDRAWLLESLETDHVRQHDLLRDYAAELAEEQESPEEIRASFDRLCSHLLTVTAAAVRSVTRPQASESAEAVEPAEPGASGAPAASSRPAERFDDPQAAEDWLARTIDTLALVADRAADTGPRWFPTELARLLDRHLDDRRQLDCAHRLHRTSATAARRIGELEAEAHAELGLAVVALRRSRRSEAEPHLERAMALLEEVHDPVWPETGPSS
ncbi:BTAD domain-containing putative transcriptional regulator [Nesterenkonia sp. K-15-9-6]|uniref:BTAD domain-containing putative transcriptional regulator n=1 Tax=Nesterenkonia sp. K-15-9-6 TaxID=3093918 RepID=UPI004043F399